MSLHHDLLRQARSLLKLEPRRPRQASLRRAVSSAYYALFHLLTEEASRLLIRGTERVALRQSLRRAFAHGTMKSVSNDFRGGRAGRNFSAVVNETAIPSSLRQVATAFVELQQARHEADYDHLRSYTRQEALDLVQQVEQAFKDWHDVKGTLAADTYLVALLAQGTMRG